MTFIVEGVVLAGGKGSRLQQNKLLLLYKNQPIITHTVSNMLEFCEKVTIVTGFYEVDYTQHINSKKSVSIIHNEDHLDGMFTSVLKGVKEIENDCFIIPGDYPLVKASTYQLLLNSDGVVRVPTYKGIKGHPIFMQKTVIDQLKKEPVDSNLKAFRNKYLVSYIEVDDEGILQDIDTINDYQQLIAYERTDAVED